MTVATTDLSLSSSPPLSTLHATFHPGRIVSQIGFLNVPFRRMDGWIIAFNEFALASKSRVALYSPFERDR